MQQSPFVQEALSSFMEDARSEVGGDEADVPPSEYTPLLDLFGDRDSVDLIDVGVEERKGGEEDLGGAATGVYGAEERRRRRAAMLSSSANVQKLVKELLVCGVWCVVCM
jgi:hypothetical protein